MGALTSVEGIADEDVQVTEDHAGAPGTVTVTVATTDLDDVRARLALERLEQVRPAGVRIFHNLVVQSVAVSDPGPGGGAEDAPPPTVDVTGVFSPIKVKAAVTPASATLGADEKTALVDEVEAAIEGFVAGLGVGPAADLQPARRRDPRRDRRLRRDPRRVPCRRRSAWPAERLPDELHAAAPRGAARRRAARRADRARRHRAVEPIGPTALLNRAVAMDDITTEIRGLVTALIAAAGGVLTRQALVDQLPDTERYNVDDVNYGVEFVDEGLRIVQQNVDIHASSEQVLWLRGLTVADSSDPAGGAG